MPRAPGIFDKVNYIVDMWSNPCNAPWMVYIETAGPAFLDVLIAIVCFDIGDVLRFIFRPTNFRGGRHGRAGRKGTAGRKPKGIRARLAAKLPPFAKLQQRSVTNGVRTLWKIDGIGQRLLWWWLVIDVGTGFLYNWTSMIYKSERCQMALAPGAAAREHTTQGFIGIQLWPDVHYVTLLYEEGLCTTLPAAFFCDFGNWAIVASLQCTNNGAEANSVELRITITAGGRTTTFPGGGTGLGVGASGGVMAVARGKGPLHGWVEVQVSNGSISTDGGHLYIQGQPPRVEPPIKYTCNSPFFPD